MPDCSNVPDGNVSFAQTQDQGEPHASSSSDRPMSVLDWYIVIMGGVSVVGFLTIAVLFAVNVSS